MLCGEHEGMGVVRKWKMNLSLKQMLSFAKAHAAF
jgi:hypothetical protein